MFFPALNYKHAAVCPVLLALGEVSDMKSKKGSLILTWNACKYLLQPYYCISFLSISNAWIVKLSATADVAMF